MDEKIIELKQIISMTIIKKKTPIEIQNIILDLITKYNISAKKLIEEIRMLNLTAEQKEKITNLEDYNKKDCKEDEETLKYLALSQYEMKKEETINRLEAIIDKSAQENKKVEKSQKRKKLKINRKEIDKAIRNKQDNLDYANLLINNIIDEISSSKKGLLSYLNSVRFLDTQQVKVNKYINRFDKDVQLMINVTTSKKGEVKKILNVQDNDVCKEVFSSIKGYIENGQTLKQSLNFQNKRNVFVEILCEKIKERKDEGYSESKENDLINQIELDEKE